LLLIGIFSWVEFYPTYRYNIILALDGEAATSAGEVVEKKKFRRRGSDWIYEVRYVFPVAEDFLTGIHECQCEELRNVQEGDAIEIRYLPDRLTMNRPAAMKYSQTWIVGNLIFGTVCLLLGLGLLIRATVVNPDSIWKRR
jgi:hypothetical protein